MPKQTSKQKRISNQVYYPFKDKRHIMTVLNYLSSNAYASTHEIAEMLGKSWSYPQIRTKMMLKRLKEFGYVLNYRVVSDPDHMCKNCNNSTKYLVRTESLDEAIRILENHKKRREEAKQQGKDPNVFFQCDDGYVLGRLIGKNCFNCHEFVNDPAYHDVRYKIHSSNNWALTHNGELAMLGILEGNKFLEFIKTHDHNRIIKLVKILLQSGKKEYLTSLKDSLKTTMEIKPNLESVADDWYNETRNVIHNMKIDEIKFPILAKYQENLMIEKQREIILNPRYGNHFPRKFG